MKLFSKNSALTKRVTAGLRLGFGLFWPLGLISMALVFSEQLKNFNYQSVSVRDLRIPLVLAIGTAMVVAVVYWRTYKRDRATGLLAAVMATLLFSGEYETKLQVFYGQLRALMPLMPPPEFEGVVISLVFMTIIFTLAGFAAKSVVSLFTKLRWDLTKLVQALIVAIVFVFLSQFLPAARLMILAWPQYSYQPKGISTERDRQGEEKPDIYYLVFDRYGSQEILATHFNFDNQAFSDFLRSRGYHVNSSGMSNYPYTPMSISSTLLANYHQEITDRFGKTEDMTHMPFFRSIKFSPVIRELKSLGYKYHHVASNYEASNTAPLRDFGYSQEGQLKIFGRQYTVDGFSQGRLRQSPVLRFLEKGLLGIKFSDEDGAALPLRQMKTLDKLAEEPAGGRFIFAHILLPHDPFYFNADGSLSPNPDANNVGKQAKQKYLEQSQYVNKRLEGLLQTINDQSQGRALVILQADEGPYPFHFIRDEFDPRIIAGEIQRGDMREWKDDELKMKYGILAAYHLPGVAKEDIDAGADPVNIFRLVLNQYFGYKLSYLPRCQFALPQGTSRAATFTDITERITGRPPDPRCAELITSEN